MTIGDLMVDCANAQRSRDFYADLMGWESSGKKKNPRLENGEIRKHKMAKKSLRHFYIGSNNTTYKALCCEGERR
jgi:catechol 2,3-dioxygenase-like lactoylglutathione lyase family enzyme